jgi:hypothetical protein
VRPGTVHGFERGQCGAKLRGMVATLATVALQLQIDAREQAVAVPHQVFDPDLEEALEVGDATLDQLETTIEIA